MIAAALNVASIRKYLYADIVFSRVYAVSDPVAAMILLSVMATAIILDLRKFGDNSAMDNQVNGPMPMEKKAM